jgi:MFS superfamily sulfate permease-like transporter
VTWFVLNTEAITEVDISGVDALESLRRDLTEQGIVFALARLKQDLRSDLAPSGLVERIGEDHVFPTLPTALAAFEQWRNDHM